jgi:hypothetical protein
MGFLRRIGSAITHNPVASAMKEVVKVNPIVSAVKIIQHPSEIIKNPISTISHLTPITSIIHEEAKKIVPSIPLPELITKAKEIAKVSIVKTESIASIIAKKPLDIAGDIVHKTEKVGESVIKGAMSIEKKAESIIGGVSHGVGGMFGDIKWIILGVVGIVGVVVVLKGKELLETGSEVMKNYKS